MKQKFLILFALSMLILLPIGYHVVLAATSNATVTFTLPSDAPPVLDPADPTQPYDPGPGDPTDPPTEETGPLTLDYVSSFDFGTHVADVEQQILESTILRPFIQVTDRRGTGAGWHVTAQLSEFSEGTPATPSLPGAYITLMNGSVISPVMDNPPTANDPVVLNAGDVAVQVVTAAEDHGLGSWITRWFPQSPTDSELNDSVTLTVPAFAASEGTHTATITWTLHDAPGQP